MIKITLRQLKTLQACEPGIIWFKKQKDKSLKGIVKNLLDDNHFDYVKWLLKNLLTKEQNQLWAINSAESVLGLFETKYPNDLRPRQAIQAAKDFLAGKITAYDAYAAAHAAADAAYAAHAAAYAAAHAAAYAADAADAADAAAHAAHAAANAAAYAAANAAAYAANAAADARKQKQTEICNFALVLLGETE